MLLCLRIFFCVAYVHKVYGHKWIMLGSFPSASMFVWFKGEKLRIFLNQHGQEKNAP